MKTIEQRIIQAFEYAKAAGYAIEADWGAFPNHKEKFVGPVGAILFLADISILNDESDNVHIDYNFNVAKNEKNAGKVLGVSEEWISNFVSGCGGITTGQSEYLDAWKLGETLQKKYCVQHPSFHY